MKLRKYNESELRNAVSNSFSLRETLKKLGIVPAGGNYQTLKNALSFFNIDKSHFTGKGHLRGKSHNYKTRPLESILVLGKYENTFRLKTRLINEGLKDKCCEQCHRTIWLGKEIPLELHHKDGNRKNNQRSNLDLLCPNCHALTDNYRGKNIKV
jgi:TPP-dependent indolepyruvate ferredoxin oxidoreductase alpha subunit